ncbi:hypothetical protein AHMF7605_18345 [Adhaeribacter arboris]|uniref:Uncharacterized protein n=1 Tax=Adhaeribacter arboris TaxID=2072846 RepID=A0A2T2YIK5_9BACT|nr:hypothetical protein [Adhaeribacter arboris]PSR55326.1 hypothetical protein AHMF7605_18345 [Adhaeribacter arboris]
MKLLSTLAPLPLAVLVISAGLLACEPKRNIETSSSSQSSRSTSADTDTIRVVQHNTNAVQELKKFKDWVNQQAGKVDSSTNKNLPGIQAEFKKRSARLEKGLDSLSGEAKAEYQAARAKYKIWEAQNKQRTSQPLQAAEIEKRQAQLLGEYKDLNTITAANVREAYLLFMGMVRAKKQNWNQNDWDYVDYVYRQLNKRKDEFGTAISRTDKLKIKSLQAEYLALEASQDAKDLIKTVKSK